MTAGQDQEGRSGGERRENQRWSGMAYGLPIGVGFGVALGLALDNLALGLAIGPAIGLAFGVAMDQRRKDADLGVEGGQRTRLLLAVGIGVLLLLVGVAVLVFRMLK